MLQDYTRVHSGRSNLLIHLVAVPLFVTTTIGLVLSLFNGNLLLAGKFALGPAIAMVLQGVGHRLETNPPEPFTGPANVLMRIFTEQFRTFPLFVLSGGWLRAWQATAGDPENQE
jgi:hypothetical protein